MRVFVRYLFLAFVFLISTLFFLTAPTSPVFADNNFDTRLDARYQVFENGVTQVTQTFSLTNKTPKFYVSEYAVVVGSNQITQVVAQEKDLVLETNVVTTTNQTSISVVFPEPLVGEGKTRTFTITYRTPDLAVINGQGLEVSVPKLASRTDFSSYTVSVVTPQKYGSPSRSFPQYTNVLPEKQNVVTIFNGLTDESVTLLFGKEQYYKLTLRYNLENPTGTTGVIQVALPPDTSRQKIEYIDLNPEPLTIKPDVDGNWIATYEIQAERQLTVYATLQAKVSLETDTTIPVYQPTASLTAPAEFWPTTHTSITSISQNLSDVRSIYNYVVNTLDYNYQKTGDLNKRLGALTALQQPQNATCMEFTDLFVTLARSKDIPSRRVTGFAYTQNNTLRPLGLVEDILHAWPEYFDSEKKEWVAVDPTWEDTTGGINYFDQFDLNHIVFAINGSSSTTPYAAGTYKLPDQITKDVDVSFAQPFVPASNALRVSVKPAGDIPIPISGQYALTISNQSGSAVYAVPLVLESEEGTRIQAATTTLDVLLPYQEVSIPFSFTTPSWTQLGSKDAKITVGTQTYDFQLNTGNYLSVYLGYSAVWFGVGVGSVGLALLAGSVLVLRRPRKRAVRRKS